MVIPLIFNKPLPETTMQEFEKAALRERVKPVRVSFPVVSSKTAVVGAVVMERVALVTDVFGSIVTSHSFDVVLAEYCCCWVPPFGAVNVPEYETSLKD